MKTHCICLCLTYFTKYNTLQAHPPMWLQMAIFHSYLWLSNISLYIYICIIHIYHITLSICLLNTCVHILPTVNNTTIGVHISFRISVFIFFQYIYPQRKLPDHMVVSVFNFLMNSYSDFHIGWKCGNHTFQLWHYYHHYSIKNWPPLSMHLQKHLPIN